MRKQRKNIILYLQENMKIENSASCILFKIILAVIPLPTFISVSCSIAKLPRVW